MMRLVLLFLVSLALAAPTAASSSDWVDAEGGRVRLVTTGEPAADGTLRGALQIELKPGWKTYWRDPGAVGVPPVLELTAAGAPVSFAIDFPVPIRFEEGDTISTGYDRSTAFALTIRVPQAAWPGRIDAKLFMGLCETICIPLQADLGLDPTRNKDDLSHRAIVDRAFAALPKPAEAGLRVVDGLVVDKTLHVTVEAPEGQTRLFLDGGGRWQFGKPRRDGDTLVFAAPVMASPAGAAAGWSTIDYVLQSRQRAVQGNFRIRTP